MKKFKILILLPILSLMPILIGGSVAALGSTSFNNVKVVASNAAVGDACQGLTQLDGTNNCNGTQNSSVDHIVQTIINILSIAIGIAAVIVIIIAGFRFITSGGDSNAVGSARSQLLYAVIGLIVVVLAQLISHETLRTANSLGMTWMIVHSIQFRT